MAITQKSDDSQNNFVPSLQAAPMSPSVATVAKPGCGVSVRGPWNLASDGIMKIRDRGGDPGLGSILFIGQLHHVPAHTRKRDLAVFDYQMRVYRLLERLAPEVIFLENEPFTLESTQIRRGHFPKGYFDEMLPELVSAYNFGLKTFQDGVPNTVTSGAARSIAILGAARLYLLSRDDVWIRPSLTLSEEVDATVEFMDLLDQGKVKLSDPAFDRLQRRRERYLAREVTNYMNHSSGPCRTVIIYGDAHLNGTRIEDAFDTYQFRPHIQSVIFPGVKNY
jgi:hypothetical protein